VSAINESVLQEENGVARPEDNPMGLVWLKWRQQVASLGLEKASETARLYKGQDTPVGKPPSAVICFSE
jgi:hypothetical protein